MTARSGWIQEPFGHVILAKSPTSKTSAVPTILHTSERKQIAITFNEMMYMDYIENDLDPLEMQNHCRWGPFEKYGKHFESVLSISNSNE